MTAALSACAYGVAFGALQMTPTRIVPGLTALAAPRNCLRPLREEATLLNQQLLEGSSGVSHSGERTAGLAGTGR